MLLIHSTIAYVCFMFSVMYIICSVECFDAVIFCSFCNNNNNIYILKSDGLTVGEFVTSVNLFGYGRGLERTDGRTDGPSHNRTEHDCGKLSLALSGRNTTGPPRAAPWCICAVLQTTPTDTSYHC